MNMDRELARQEIRRSWKMMYPADKKGKGIICPLCGSGSGRKGTGITENPEKPGQLKCWSCGFQGDVIDLIREKTGADYDTALKSAAAELGITIDPYRLAAAADFADTAQNAQNAAQGGFSEPDDIKPGQENKTPENAAQDAAAEDIADYRAYYKQCRQRLNDPAALSYLQARGISPETAAAYLSLGINSTRKLADEHGLIVRFGRRVLIDRVKLDEVLAEMGN